MEGEADMNFDQMLEGVIDAEHTIRMADIATRKVAYLIRGRLRSGDVPSSVLEDLKRELRDFNIHTGMWRKK